MVNPSLQPHHLDAIRKARLELLKIIAFPGALPSYYESYKRIEEIIKELESLLGY